MREINAGLYAFEVPALLAVLGGLAAPERPGRVLPHRRGRPAARGGQTVDAVKAADPGEALGVNTVAELAEATRLLRAAARGSADGGRGVASRIPASTHIGLDVTVEPDAVLRPYTILEGRTIVRAGRERRPLRAPGGRRDRARRAGPRPLPAARVRGGRGRHGRALRAHPPGEPHRRAGQGGQLRGAEEDAAGRRVQGPAPLLPRRRHDRPGREHRRRHHHLQLRRHPQAPDAHRGGRLHRQQQHAGGARHGGRRAPTWPRAARSPRTCPRAPWRSAAPGRS